MIWEAQYSVRLEEIDAQHRYFVSLLERIEVASASCQTAQLMPIVEELLRYARYHFASEEALMNAYGYDGTSHRIQHAELLTRIDSMRADLNFRAAQLRLFVYKWLVVHIQLEDTAMADWVLERRAKAYAVDNGITSSVNLVKGSEGR